jgi:hypothetical protein
LAADFDASDEAVGRGVNGLVTPAGTQVALPPMNQLDATATPMFDCFTSTPDFTAFDAATNTVPLDGMNPDPRQIPNAQLRKDALVSAKLPLDTEDQCPEDVFKRILWRALKGPQTPYPNGR